MTKELINIILSFFNRIEYKDIENQLKKIHEEVSETAQEINNFNPDKRYAMGLELFDVMQACYTALINNYAEKDIKVMNQALLKKLIDRYNEKIEAIALENDKILKKELGNE